MESALLSLIAGRSAPTIADAMHAANADDTDAAAYNDMFRAVVAQVTGKGDAQTTADVAAVVLNPQTQQLQVIQLAGDAANQDDLVMLPLTLEQLQAMLQDAAALTAQSTDIEALDAQKMALRWLPEALQAVQVAAAEQAAQQAVADGQEQQLIAALDEEALLTLNQPLTSEALQAIEELAQWVQQLKAQAEAQAQQEGVALVGSALIPMPPLQQGSWHSQWQAIAAAAQQIRTGDVAQPADAEVAAPLSPLAQAIAADDISLLSDAELAKLDALVDKIAQQGANGSDALKQFGALLDEQLADLRLQTGATQQESLQPSTLSVSHASHQTRALDEGLQLRAFGSPLFQGSAQQGNAADQVKVSIGQALGAGLDRVTIQLDPADLGRVDVRIDVGADGRAQLLVQADNRDTLDLLQRDARALERALQEAGIQADLRDMAFNLRDNQSQSRSDRDGAATANAISASEDEVAATAQNDNDALMGSYTLSIAQGLNIQV